jgi:hypothetical protein
MQDVVVKCPSAWTTLLNAICVCEESLRVQAAKWNASDPDLRGKLQASFVAALQQCPTPIVLVHNLGKAPLDAVPVLLTALSEEGSFFSSGTSRPTHDAIIFATVKVSASDITEVRVYIDTPPSLQEAEQKGRNEK